MLSNFTNIIDISLPLSESTVVYPGNPKVKIETLKSETSSSILSQITLGSHTATHVDAPKHVSDQGAGVDQIKLKKLIGTCRVLDLTGVTKSIKAKNLEVAEIKDGERILVKTRNSQRGFSRFYDDYVYLSPEGATYLAQRDISLFGIDSLSVKQRGSSDNRPHTKLLKHGIVIFEGLDLSKVSEGEYFFIGLPLKFVGLDGSPSRAVLIK